MFVLLIFMNDGILLVPLVSCEGLCNEIRSANCLHCSILYVCRKLNDMFVFVLVVYIDVII